MKDLITREKEFLDRNQKIFKSNEMIQKSRNNLSIEEQRLILFLISKIQPEDTEFTFYEFELKDFYSLCGLRKDSYSRLKEIIKDLRSKSWWITLMDDEGEYETTVSWIDKPILRERSGKVSVKLDKDLIPYLLELKKHYEEDGLYNTGYYLKFVLPMKSKYGIRLYEILKSYAYNNSEWFFDIDKLRYLMGCAKIVKKTPKYIATEYLRFNDFKRWVIEPAIKDINTYTDLNITVEYKKEGYPVKWVIFTMIEKGPKELGEADQVIREQLDGQIDYLAELEKAQSAEYKKHE